MPVPKHIIAVSAYVTNQEGQVLLVRTHQRSDTWELPGGQVEEGEPLDQAVSRECSEETGLNVRPLGITGVYYNTTSHILSIVYQCEYVDGELKVQPEEIGAARFISLTESNIDEYITRPHMKSRTLDAMKNNNFVPYEAWKVRPYELISRIE